MPKTINSSKSRPTRKPARRKPTTRNTPAPVIAQAPGATLGEASVTISMAQLDALRNEAKTAQVRVAELEVELEAAKKLDPAGRIEDLRGLIREGLMPIVRFAFANLPPSEIVGWPYEAVTAAADQFHVMPDFSADDQVLVGEMRFFALDVQEHNIERARKRSELVVAGGKLPKSPAERPEMNEDVELGPAGAPNASG